MKQQAQLFCLLVLTSLCLFPSYAASADLYNQKPFTSPLHDLPSSCQPCVDFYYVSRPILPAVDHEFIGAKIEAQCETDLVTITEVYGLTKGEPDLQYFNEQRKLATSSDLIHLFQFCGFEADLALNTAAAVSNDWLEFYGSWISLLSRMAATPILGRPCAKAAQDVKDAITGKLRTWR